jgi:alpha-D-ribose 1-methylphosphonate 5-triphosphate synthase subunit PhnG
MVGDGEGETGKTFNIGGSTASRAERLSLSEKLKGL